MALTISSLNLSKLMAFEQQAQIQSNPAQGNSLRSTSLTQVDASSVTFSAKNDPTALILQSAMEKINEMFAPHIGDGTLQKAIESGQDMSPKATAERILSFATQLIGRAEADQADLPLKEQRSRARLFQNIQTGVERGFEQARSILDGMQVLDGPVKETVNSTYAYTQQGLQDLAKLLGLQAVSQIVV